MQRHVYEKNHFLHLNGLSFLSKPPAYLHTDLVCLAVGFSSFVVNSCLDFCSYRLSSNETSHGQGGQHEYYKIHVDRSSVAERVGRRKKRRSFKKHQAGFNDKILVFNRHLLHKLFDLECLLFNCQSSTALSNRSKIEKEKKKNILHWSIEPRPCRFLNPRAPLDSWPHHVATMRRAAPRAELIILITVPS